MQLQSGTLLQEGKYKIESVLGQGGFGITYLAVQKIMVKGSIGELETEIKVAIKEFFMKDVCNRDSSSHVSVPSVGSKEMVERFKQKFVKEAKNISLLKHPNIIKVLDIFEENDTAYYVMEYIPNGSLQQYISENGPLQEIEALHYIQEIAGALDYIHSQHMNHLDIKPGNILRRNNTDAVLIDFGLSKRYDEEGHQTSTTPVGISTGYAPMEQYKKGGVGTFSPATDIYSLGATLYKLLTGQTPPDASDVFDNGLPALPTTVSRNVQKAILAAMEPKRSERPQSICEFLGILDGKQINTNEKREETIIENEEWEEEVRKLKGTSVSPIPTTKPTGTTVDEERPKIKSQFRKSVITYICITIVLICGIGIYNFNHATKFYDNLENIAIGDYLYSDGTYSHILEDSKKDLCSGVVYNLTTIEAEKMEGWTHGHVVALQDAVGRNGEKLFSWGPDYQNDYITNAAEYIEASKDYNGYWNCLYDSTSICPAITAIEDLEGPVFKVPLPGTSSWYLPALGDWIDILVNLGQATIKTENNSLSCYDDSKVAPILQQKINACIVSPGMGSSKDFDYEYWTSTQQGREYAPDGYYTHRAWAIYGGSGYGNIGNSPKNNKKRVRPVAAF